MRGNSRPKAICIAIVTMIAVLIASFCGPACATAIGCESSATIAGSAETCHHAAVSNTVESENTASSSARSCNRHELPAILNASQKLSALENVSTFASRLSSSNLAQFASPDLATFGARWLDDDIPLGAVLPAKSTSILRT